MLHDNKYTENGTVFFQDGPKKHWAVQISYNIGGPGANFKTIKWATWENEHYFLGLQETNESFEMYGWQIATPAFVVLHCDQQTIDKLDIIKSLVNFTYKGHFNTNVALMNELEWRFHGYK